MTNYSTTGELYYTGMTQPQHLMRVAKTNIMFNYLSQTDNARLSEGFLNKLDFDRHYQARAKAFGIEKNDVSAQRMEDYINHIHSKYSEIVRERFNKPMLSDEEAGNLLYEQTLKSEIEKLLKDKEIDIRL